MSVVKIFTPENRLAKVIGGLSDPTADDLATRAEARVATLRDSIRVYVGEMRQVILTMAEQREELIFAECKEIGAAALGICDVAGAAGLGATGEAARGIHIMIDALIRHGVWHTEALKLHIDALALLNADPEPSAQAAKKILDDLKSMRDWVGVADEVVQARVGCADGQPMN